MFRSWEEFKTIPCPQKNCNLPFCQFNHAGNRTFSDYASILCKKLTKMVEVTPSERNAQNERKRTQPTTENSDSNTCKKVKRTEKRNETSRKLVPEKNCEPQQEKSPTETFKKSEDANQSSLIYEGKPTGPPLTAILINGCPIDEKLRWVFRA